MNTGNSDADNTEVKRYIVSCPKCKSEYEIKKSDLGKHAECAECKTVFQIKLYLSRELVALKSNKIVDCSNLEPLKIGNTSIKIINLTEHREYGCGDCMCDKDGCSKKKKTSLAYQKGKLIGTELLLDITNSSNTEFVFQHKNISLIDAEGYSIEPAEHCFEYGEMCPRFSIDSYVEIKAHNRLKCAVLFPECENEICAFQVVYEKSIYKIQIREFREDVTALLNGKRGNESQSEEIQQENPSCSDAGYYGGWITGKIKPCIDYLEQLIFQRLNNTLTEREIIKLNDNIANICFKIEQAFRAVDSSSEKTKLEEQYQKIKNDYSEKLQECSIPDSGSPDFLKRFNSIMELSPYEFEEWCAELFSKIGFTKTTVTPKTNDKGVDVFCKKSGELIAIQCKKYKGVVGAPEIQNSWEQSRIPARPEDIS